MYKGKLVGICAVEEYDLKQLMDWRNTTDFRKYFREYRELNMDNQKNWFINSVINDASNTMFAIRRLDDNKLLGCCGFVYINWVHRHADLSLYIGHDDLYIDDIGYAEEACNLLMNYGFKELCLNKIWTEIYEFDKPKKDLYDKFGFEQDGLLRENYFYDGRFWDSRILSILKENWDK